MKNIRSILLFLLLAAVFHDTALARKKKTQDKKETKKETVTPYQKLFKDKKMVTVEGLMKMHLMDRKVYAEFPVDLLNKDMLLAASIVTTNDNGEGVVGQFGDRSCWLRFTRLDSTLQARMIYLRGLENTSGAGEPDRNISSSQQPGIYKSFKIEAISPDSTAVVVNMSDLFLEHSDYTNPFASYAGNSLFGLVKRIHKFQKERSLLKGIKACPENITVTCELSYDVDRKVFGNFSMATDAPVTATVNRILTLLPEQPMQPRIADPRIGSELIAKSELQDMATELKPVYYVKRWRIEPADLRAYEAGETVNPRKPILFYLDTLMPESWKKYVREGALAWNSAFEKIGFKNVIQVKDFPRTPSFDANNIQYSTIRYAPLWMYFVQNSMLTDPRSGEILNASVYIHSNVVSALYTTRIENTMAVDPSVRKANLSETQMGEMLKAEIMQAVGKCLGLAENLTASSAYPVDSLRSASFTRENGLSPSIMDDIPYNFIAQPEDVEKGVVLVPQKLGVYDYFTLKYLYQVIPQADTPAKEKATLSQWADQTKQNPWLTYRRTQKAWTELDPTTMRNDLGDDPFKAMEYGVKNLKISVQNFFDWYKENDENMALRKLIYDDLIVEFNNRLNAVLACIGGIEINEVEGRNGQPPYRVYDKGTQQKALRYAMKWARDLSWLSIPEIWQQMEIQDFSLTSVRQNIINQIFNRIYYVSLASEKSGGAYTPDDYINDIYQLAWEKTKQMQPLTKGDMEIQQIFLSSIIATSCVNAAPAVLEPTNGTAFYQPSFSWQQGFSVLPEKTFRPEKNAGMICPQPDEIFRTLTAQKTKTLASSILPEETAGFQPLPAIRIMRDPVASLYYQMLLKTRDLLNRAVVKANGETRQHYEFLLFQIKKAIEKKKNS